MENLLENKVLLRELLMQGDLLNTINGGVSETYMEIKEDGRNIIIRLFAAGALAKDFKVMLKKNRLTISRLLEGQQESQYMSPVFSRWFDLPISINRKEIEAVFEDGYLKIILPTEGEIDLNRDIEIKE
jgi:HSP20 family protein